MRLIKDLSLRYKIPLRVMVLVIGTALAVTASLVFHEMDELRRNLIANADNMGGILAKTLVAPMMHDDVWRAYEILSTPSPALGQSDLLPGKLERGAEVMLILDRKQQVYVSRQPADYPMFSDPAQINPEYLAVQRTQLNLNSSHATVVESPDSKHLFLLTPIVSDGELLGTLVMSYSKALFLPRFYNLAQRAALVTLMVLAVLLPISWYWGQRTAVPLVKLADAMGKTGARLPDPQELALEESGDEIGRLGSAFKRMLAELEEKANLEQQMVLADRLAAIGRLAAGVAHEINNPLGGMLNAINTYQRHGDNDPMVKVTLSLLERGLLQIKDTVAALLVEVKVQSHPLERQDIEDVRTLVQPNLTDNGVALVWENDVLGPLPLPSTLIRQIMINLLLNAVHASGKGGQVCCHAYRSSSNFFIEVKNNGNYIPQEKLPYLFEPFAYMSTNGHGLGLWVTYQVVQQLGGEISVASEPDNTCFTVQLPLPETYGHSHTT